MSLHVAGSAGIFDLGDHEAPIRRVPNGVFDALVGVDAVDHVSVLEWWYPMFLEIVPCTLAVVRRLRSCASRPLVALVSTFLAACLVLAPQSATAGDPVFCALSRVGLAAPSAEMKPRRSSAGECLFRVSDRRMYVEITPLMPDRFDAMMKGGAIDRLPSEARLMREEKLVVDGRDVLLRSYAVPGAGQPRLWIVALSRIDGVPVMTIAVAQFIKLLSFSKEQLRETVLSTAVRPPLTETEYKKELPIDIADFAGFEIKSISGPTIKMEPKEPPDATTAPISEVTIRVLELVALPNPQATDTALTNALEADIQLTESPVIEKREIVQREGLDWYEFKATGKSSRMPGEVFAAAYLRMEAGKRIIRIEGLFPLEKRTSFEARLAVLADNIGLR
jgi:hypothetical protein